MKIFMTGGAGFVGCNAARRFIEAGHEVIIYDNLSRKGSAKNLDWLREKGEFTFIPGDIRDYGKLLDYFTTHPGVDVVFHLAAQVSVSSSILNPQEDFQINARGTLNLLEAIRNSKSNPVMIFISSNKVYGNLEGLAIEEEEKRFVLRDLPQGISEKIPTRLLSPYACSKGMAEAYIGAYQELWGLGAVIFRASCIYGPRQFGTEEQGWVAHFILSTLEGRVINIYGNGKQTRDILYVEDLIALFSLALENMENIKGEVFNVGGGVDNTISLLELVSFLEGELKKGVSYRFMQERVPDQKIFISDNSLLKKELGWNPQTNPTRGLSLLIDWAQKEYLHHLYPVVK